MSIKLRRSLIQAMKNKVLLFLLLFQLSVFAQVPFEGDSLPRKGIQEIIVDSSKLKAIPKKAVEEASPVLDIAQEKTAAETLKVVVRDTIRETKVEKLFEKPDKEKDSENVSPLKTLGEILSFQKIFWTIFILLFAYYFLKIISLVIDRWSKRSPQRSAILKKTLPIIKLAGWIIAIILIEQTVIQLPSETLFALLASAGIAIGFAAQDMLKNIFGGIMILFDRPFQIGDKIEVGEYYGEVKEIGLRSTRIITPDDSLVSIPNAEVVNKAVSNANGGENNCQVVAEIYLPENIDTKLVRKIAEESAQTSRYIYINKPITVLFFHEVNKDKTYLKMRLKAYVSDLRNEFKFKSDMTEVFIQELIKRGILNNTNK